MQNKIFSRFRAQTYRMKKRTHRWIAFNLKINENLTPGKTNSQILRMHVSAQNEYILEGPSWSRFPRAGVLLFEMRTVSTSHFPWKILENSRKFAHPKLTPGILLCTLGYSRSLWNVPRSFLKASGDVLRNFIFNKFSTNFWCHTKPILRSFSAPGL